MQDHFVGDVGDFANNGLLRWLTGMHGPKMDAPLPLGVAWYYNHDICRAGNLISYLEDTPANRQRFAACDPVLYDALRDLVHNGNRSVRALEQSGVLPQGTAYHRELLCWQTDRAAWMNGVLQETADSQLVFVNPDNGIVSGQIDPASPKHVPMEELRHFVNRGQSLVIYHHLGRNRAHERQIRDIHEALQRELGLPVYALRYGAFQARAYFIAAQLGEHQRVIEGRLGSFLASPWGNLFQRVV